MQCHRCGTDIDISIKITRQQECPKCSSYLHCCLNCIFFKEDAYHQCREPQAEFVNDKTYANYCGYFKPADSKKSSQKEKSDEARKKLEALFGNSEGGNENDA